MLDNASTRKTKHGVVLFKKPSEAHSARGCSRYANQGQPWTRGYPGEVARRQIAIKEAMQKARIGRIKTLKFGLNPDQELFIAPKTQMSREGRARPVGR